MNDKKQTVFSNLIWRFMERCGAQVVAFVVSIVLARLLDPALYGRIALVTVITSILNVFVDSGMANALIQKKDTDDLDSSSVFYFNVAFCLVLYLGLFLAAPLLSRFYHDSSLVPVFRVLGLTIVISGVKNVQQAYVAKTLQFRRFFFSTLGGTVLSAIVGITMAYRGFGIWALVTQQVLNAAVNTAILWLTVGWKPRRIFSLERLKGLVSYGWKILVSGLLDTVYLKLYQLVVGLRYTEADLAFYNKADQMPLLLVERHRALVDRHLIKMHRNIFFRVIHDLCVCILIPAKALDLCRLQRNIELFEQLCKLSPLRFFRRETIKIQDTSACVQITDFIEQPVQCP